jgi:DNA-binding transcriptional LysR family regulator
MSRRLLRFARAIYASPDYIEEMGLPVTLDDLAKHRITAHSIVDVRDVQWNRNGKRLRKPKALPKPRWIINDSAALERFVLSREGLAFLATIEGESLTAQGERVRVLPEVEQEGATASLIWAPGFVPSSITPQRPWAMPHPDHPKLRVPFPSLRMKASEKSGDTCGHMVQEVM